MTLDTTHRDSWQGFLGLLRPPEGYRVAAAVGTTYGLSFDALVAALLAMQGVEDEQIARDPVSCVVATTRLAPRVRILFHPGTIEGSVEGLSRRFVGMLDRVLVPIPVRNGLFHPKVWALAFDRLDRPELARSPARRVRLVVGSRNLTRSRSFEIGAVIEGAPGDGKDPLAHDVARAVEGWLATGSPGGGPFEALPTWMRAATLNVPGEGEETLRLRWQGLGARPLADHLPARLGRVILVAPFLRGDFLRHLLDRSDELRVVSTAEALAELDEATFSRLEEREKDQEAPALYAVKEHADLEDTYLDGVHAKLLVADDGKRSVTFVGSANGTGPGWGIGGANVEAMLELRPGLGHDRFLRGFVVDKAGPRPWIERFTRQDRPTTPPEPDAAERLLALLRRVATVDLQLTYDSHLRTLQLRVAKDGGLPARTDQPDETLDVAPLATMDAEAGWRPLGDLAHGPIIFPNIELADVSAFVAIRAREGDVSRVRVTLARLELTDGERELRDDAARQALLEAARPEDVLRAIVLGLGHVGSARRGVAGGSKGAGQASTHKLFEEVSLERVLRAVAEDAELVRDLQLLLGQRGDPSFVRFCDDLEAASRAVSGAR